MKRTLSGLVLLVWMLVATALADEAQVPPMSVWYRFDSDQTIGQSVGANPWPAYPLAAKTGPGKFGEGLVIKGTGEIGRASCRERV